MEKEIVFNAIQALKLTTGIQANFKEKGMLDGVLTFVLNSKKYEFIVEIKNELRGYQLSQIEESFKRNEHFLLIANRIFPSIKEELRKKEIPYLEANGNVYLKKDEIFLFVDSQKPLDVEKNKGNRAFTKTGLKVLFYLLQNKDAINLPQRQLADLTGVALGNIPQIIEGLKDTGYLIALKKKIYIWENRKALLERWMADYAIILRPMLVKGLFTIKGNWNELALNTYKTQWGGEPAADLLTNHLRPEKFIIYTKENRMDLIKNYKLMPNISGEVEVLEMFWKSNDDTIPPLLVYTDLILEGGKRNKETAEIIFNEYIQPNL